MRSLLGRRAELRALSYLRGQGLCLHCKNYRTRFGEIDLIMRDHQQWVFIEVRSRTSNEFMDPVETIGPGKQRRLWLSGQLFLQDVDGGDFARFDVVTIIAGQEPRWIVNAFHL